MRMSIVPSSAGVMDRTREKLSRETHRRMYTPRLFVRESLVGPLSWDTQTTIVFLEPTVRVELVKYLGVFGKFCFLTVMTTYPTVG